MPIDSGPQPDAAFYEIRVQGQLGPEWSPWFEGLAVTQETDLHTGGMITVLSGTVPDQPTLHGILGKIRDLNLKLVSVLTIFERSL